MATTQAKTTKKRRPHRATGRPRGRPRKEPAEQRRYGPEQDQDDIEALQPAIRMDMKAMSEAQLRSFAMNQYGRRYADDDSIDVIRDDLMRRSDVGRFARYL